MTDHHELPPAPSPPSVRPQLYDEAVRRAAVLPFLDALYEWGGNDYDDETATRERIVTDVADALKHECDAYRVCRRLEDDGYDSDAELGEIVAQVLRNLYSAHEGAERTWVLSTGGPPQTFEVGDKVAWHPLRMKTGAVFTGEVIKVDTERAKYHVFCEELGHIRPGERRSGVHASVVNFEDAWASQPAKVEGT